MYIYQQNDWPNFRWDNDSIIPILSKVRNLQGLLFGKMESLGFDLRNEATLETMTIDIVKTSEIEGEILNTEQVRSSIAKKLGIEISGLITSGRNVDGIVELTTDAIQNFNQPLSKERLFYWHSSLFNSVVNNILIGNWRNDLSGPMQIVSGPMGKELVHFQAPDAQVIPAEMEIFINYFNNKEIETILKAGIIHLWFVTLHPFEDGNGRIARTLTDMLLARADGSSLRFYSMSAQIQKERKNYYEILEETQKGNLDITAWLLWFLNCLLNSLNSAEDVLTKVLYKSMFWKNHATTILNERQQKMINKILDGFEGNLTSSKWAKITKCSQDTALRDIQDLINKNILRKENSGGRSTNYEFILE